MKLVSLSQVSHLLYPGVTLAWSVRDANGTLLLAKGHVLADERAVQTLLDRGMFIDAAEVAAAAAANRAEAPKDESMSGRWSGLENRLGTLLKSSTEPNFLQKVRESVVSIAALADGNVDLLIFLILRHDYKRVANYSVVHALHSAALCSLLTRRLGWPEPKRYSVLGAALTMNISMLELQNNLAIRTLKPSDAERQVIAEHPTVSATMLRDAGLADVDWLTTVEQHHERRDGKGYPLGLTDSTEMSRLLNFVDTFTAKHSPRAGRTPQPAHRAARDLFTHSGGDPLAALVIKEFGIYPPGCYVRLASGEVAIVVQRGASANAPIVAAITNKNGDSLTQPVRRDTSTPANAIAATVAEELIRVRVSVDRLYDQKTNR